MAMSSRRVIHILLVQESTATQIEIQMESQAELDRGAKLYGGNGMGGEKATKSSKPRLSSGVKSYASDAPIPCRAEGGMFGYCGLTRIADENLTRQLLTLQKHTMRERRSLGGRTATFS